MEATETVTPQASPPIGALGTALTEPLERPMIASLVLAFVVGLAGPLLVLYAVSNGFASAETVLFWTWVAAAICIASFVLGCAVATLLPALLLSGPDRAASVAHAWIGAREVRRVFGSAGKAIGLPTTPEAAQAWLASNADTDQLRPFRFEMLLFARRFEEARRLIERFSRATPLDEYRIAEARLLVDDQLTGQVDESPLQAAIERIAPGLDRVEAIVSRAVFRARRRVGRGDWRAPLVEARSHIPGSDAAILVRDLGLTTFNYIWPRLTPPLAALVLIIAGFITVSVPR
jgi:hypothetical protein